MRGLTHILASVFTSMACLFAAFFGTGDVAVALFAISVYTDSRVCGLAMNCVGARSFDTVSVCIVGRAVTCTSGHANNRAMRIVCSFTMSSAYTSGLAIVFACESVFIAVPGCAGSLAIACTNVRPILS